MSPSGQSVVNTVRSSMPYTPGRAGKAGRTGMLETKDGRRSFESEYNTGFSIGLEAGTMIGSVECMINVIRKHPSIAAEFEEYENF